MSILGSKNDFLEFFLVSKNDFIELICKFKGHIVSQADIKQLNNANKVIFSTCKRCSFGITIKMDPDDKDYCLVSDYDW